MADSEGRKVEVESIDQIGIVVEDCDKVKETWERMLGIGPWTTMTNTGTDAEGNPVEVKLAFAYVGDLELELIEVVKGKLAHSEWLAAHGEGLQHLSFFADDPDEDTAKLVVVDPKKIDIARRADLWVRVRPGADGALAMGVIKVIIEERLYDEDFVEKWTVGFDELREHAKTFTLEDVERVTWVPQAQVQAFARMCARLKPTSIHPGNVFSHASSPPTDASPPDPERNHGAAEHPGVGSVQHPG